MRLSHALLLSTNRLRRSLFRYAPLGILAVVPTTLLAVTAPTFSKAFQTNPIATGGTTNLVFSITNPNATALSGSAGNASFVNFTDTLPAGLTKTGGIFPNGNCIAGFDASTSTTIQVNGIGVAASATCTLTVSIGVNSAPASLVNTTSPFHTVEAPDSNIATDTLVVVGAPTISKSFSTPFGPLNPGDQSTITVTLANPNTIALTGVAFTDTLPTGLVVSSPSGLTSTCGGVAVAAPTSLSLSGGSIAATSTCAVTVNVTNQAIIGPVTNPAITVTSNEAPAGVSTPASLPVDSEFFLWFFFST